LPAVIQLGKRTPEGHRKMKKGLKEGSEGRKTKSSFSNFFLKALHECKNGQRPHVVLFYDFVS
jgi:hypothetical protein